MKPNPLPALDEEQRADVLRLKALVARARELRPGLTQDKLAEACGWNSQGNVQNYLGGRTPLNLDAAYRFAKALEVPIESFSPRLANQAAEFFSATQKAKQLHFAAPAAEPPRIVAEPMSRYRVQHDTAMTRIQKALAGLETDLLEQLADLIEQLRKTPAPRRSTAKSQPAAPSKRRTKASA